MSAYRYEIRTAPGCCAGPDRPVHSRHRTLEAAVLVARRSDRVVVEPCGASVVLYHARSQQPTRYGYGLYGGPDTRPLAECVAEAREAEMAWRGASSTGAERT